MKKSNVTSDTIIAAITAVSISNRKPQSESGSFLSEVIKIAGIDKSAINDVDFDIITLFDRLGDEHRQRTLELLFHVITVLADSFNCWVTDSEGNEASPSNIELSRIQLNRDVIKMKSSELIESSMQKTIEDAIESGEIEAGSITSIKMPDELMSQLRNLSSDSPIKQEIERLINE